MLPVHEDIDKLKPPLFKKTIARGKVASIIFRGEFSGMAQACEKIILWIEKNNLKISGNMRIVHLRCPRNTSDVNGLITEIQIPVK